MNQSNIDDPLDLADDLNTEEDNNYSLHPAIITSSNYYDIEEVHNLCSTLNFKNNLSMLSLNIRSIHGKYEELRDFLYDLPNKFSIFCLQEVWSVSHEYPING